MKVRFFRGWKTLREADMGAVPRPGDVVMLDAGENLMTWGVAWDLTGGEPVAWVQLKTEASYNQALYRRDDPASEPRPRQPEEAR